MKREFNEWPSSEADFPLEQAADWELIYSVMEQITLTATFENPLPSARELKVLRELVPDLTHEPPHQLKARIGDAQKLELGAFSPAEAQALMRKMGQRGVFVRAADASHRGYLPIHRATQMALVIEDEALDMRLAEQMKAAGVEVVMEHRYKDDVKWLVEQMNTSIEWNTIWRMQSHIAGLYQLQLADSDLDGDWSSEIFFVERYLDVFCCDLPHLTPSEEDHLLRGCLFMVACLCLNLIYGSNLLLREHRETCETAIRNSVRLDGVEFLREYTLELLEKVRQADIARQNLVTAQTEVDLAIIQRKHRTSVKVEADPKALRQFKDETVYHYFAWCQQRALELQATSPTP